MNQQDRYRGNGPQRDRNDGRGPWQPEDEQSLLDRGNYAREPGAGEQINDRPWQRDYGRRGPAYGQWTDAYGRDSSMSRHAEATAPSRLASGYSGRGPRGYVRSDERIREDVCEHLSVNDYVDASDIDVTVKDRKVLLTGTVENRRMKHLAEDIAEMVSGVDDVDNRITVRKPLLRDMADRIMGHEPEQRHANSGTRNAPAASSVQPGNGRS